MTIWTDGAYSRSDCTGSLSAPPSARSTVSIRRSGQLPSFFCSRKNRISMSVFQYTAPLAPWAMVDSNNLHDISLADEKAITRLLCQYRQRAREDGCQLDMFDHMIKCRDCKRTLASWDLPFLRQARKMAEHSNMRVNHCEKTEHESKHFPTYHKMLDASRRYSYRTRYLSNKNVSDFARRGITTSASDDELYNSFRKLSNNASKRACQSATPGHFETQWCRILAGFYMNKREGGEDALFGRLSTNQLRAKASLYNSQRTHTGSLGPLAELGRALAQTDNPYVDIINTHVGGFKSVSELGHDGPEIERFRSALRDAQDTVSRLFDAWVSVAYKGWLSATETRPWRAVGIAFHSALFLLPIILFLPLIILSLLSIGSILFLPLIF